MAFPPAIVYCQKKRSGTSSDRRLHHSRFGTGGKEMRRKAWAGATLCVALAAASGAPAQTLEEELRVALQSHPAIAAVQDDLEVADEAIGEAFSEYLPDLDVLADAGYEVTDSPGRRADNDGNFEAFRRRAGATLNQKVFDGLRREGNLRTARLNRAIADLTVDDTVQQILLRGAEAYHNVLRNDRLVELSEANVQTIREKLRLETERVERGGGLKVDELLAKTRLQIAKEQLVTFQGDLMDANSIYIDVFEKLPDVARMQEPIPPLELLPKDMQTAVDIAIGERPSVLINDRRVDVADAQRTVARSDWFPQIDIVGGANYENDFDGTPGERRDFNVVLQITWKIFDGLARPSRVSQAASAYSSSLDRLAFAKRQAAEEARITFNELLNARDRVTLLENAVDLAREVFAARSRLREAGRESAINLLDAELELFLARINLTNAVYDSRIAAYQVLEATGQLTPQNLKLVP